jgi:hypothetical protein
VTRTATVLADVGWLVSLWLMVPAVIIVVCAPVALLIRLMLLAAERL